MNIIHPTAVFGQNVVIGDNNYIGPFCFFDNCVIGSNNRFESHCVIGAPAQHLKHFSHAKTKCIIGDNNCFRSFTTVDCGIEYDTVVRSKCFIMAYSHVSHDTCVESNVTLANSVQIGGHSLVCKGATIGLGCLIHQYSLIGSYAMLGMGCVVSKKTEIRPLSVYAGVPAKRIGRNTVAIERNGIDEWLCAEIVNEYDELIKKRNT